MNDHTNDETEAVKSQVFLLVAAAALFGSVTAGAAPAGAAGQRPANSAAQTQRHEQQVRDRREDAEGDVAREERQMREREVQEGASAPNERSAEMQERKQERKEIKEEYKTAERQGDAGQVKGKKPWWKFWESEDSE